MSTCEFEQFRLFMMKFKFNTFYIGIFSSWQKCFDDLLAELHSATLARNDEKLRFPSWGLAMGRKVPRVLVSHSKSPQCPFTVYVGHLGTETVVRVPFSSFSQETQQG